MKYYPCTSRSRIASQPLTLTMNQLVNAVAWWSTRLGLSDWAIEIAWKSKHESSDAMGLCDWTLTRKHAWILIQRAEDADPDATPMDMEHVLVHELLHLHFAAWTDLSESFDRPDVGKLTEAVCMEQPIDILAWALVDMRRRDPRSRMSWERNK